MSRPQLVPGPDHPITIEPHPGTLVVTFGGQEVARTSAALSLREASYPAVPYIPRGDVDPAVLERTDHATYCPYKGEASYFSLRVGQTLAENAIWTYETPYDAVAPIKEYVAFYPNRVSIEQLPAA